MKQIINFCLPLPVYRYVDPRHEYRNRNRSYMQLSQTFAIDTNASHHYITTVENTDKRLSV